MTDWHSKLETFKPRPVYGDKNTPVTSEYLDTLEAQIGCSLPADYKDFILTTGGVLGLTRASFPVHGFEETECIAVIFGRDGGSNYDLIANFKDLGEDLEVPVLPIGSDHFGNYLFLGLHGEQKGKFYFWELHPASDAETNVHWVADTFTQFIDSLRSFSADE